MMHLKRASHSAWHVALGGWLCTQQEGDFGPDPLVCFLSCQGGSGVHGSLSSLPGLRV